MIANRVGPAIAQPYWDDFLVQFHAAQVQFPSGLAADSLDEPTLQQWISCLENVVRWEPTHVSAHARLAETHQRLFAKLQLTALNPMPLPHIADAATQAIRGGNFPSRKSLAAWLSAAIGPHWRHLERALDHARKVVTLCPLEGRAYLALAELSFLEGDDGRMHRALIDQALRVRPWDGAVLFAVSEEASLEGDQAARWNTPNAPSAPARTGDGKSCRNYAASTSPEELPALAESISREFQPDWWTLQFLYDLCAARCSPQALAPLRAARPRKRKSRPPPRKTPTPPKSGSRPKRFTHKSATMPRRPSAPETPCGAIRTASRPTVVWDRASRTKSSSTKPRRT